MQWINVNERNSNRAELDIYVDDFLLTEFSIKLTAALCGCILKVEI